MAMNHMNPAMNPMMFGAGYGGPMDMSMNMPMNMPMNMQMNDEEGDENESEDEVDEPEKSQDGEKLKDLMNEYKVNEEDKGPDIEKDVADIVNSIWLGKKKIYTPLRVAPSLIRKIFWSYLIE